MIELGKEYINRSDLLMRPLGASDFFEFRNAAKESTGTNYEYLSYGELFENLNIFDFSSAYSTFLNDSEYEHWGVFHRKKELVGHVGFSFASGPFGAEILGWVRKGYQSQGIGEISLQTACGIAFNTKSFNYVELKIKQSNKPSRRAAEKVGFIPVLKLGLDIIGGEDPFIVYIKIHPDIKLASQFGYRPIDIMNNPATQPPLRYMLKNNNVHDFWSWPFPKFIEDMKSVDYFEYHGYMALLGFSPEDIERAIKQEGAAAGDGVY